MQHYGMQTKTTLLRKTILVHLQKNRDAHTAGFAEALSDWRDAVSIALAELSEEFNATNPHADSMAEAETAKQAHLLELNNDPATSLRHLTKPQDMSEAYDEVIQLFELDTREEVELESHEFRAFILDKWDWSKGWHATNAVYAASAAR